jgi:hypothetical protein
MDEKRVSKILPEYIKLAKKDNRDIEVLFHPGYLDKNQTDFEDKNIVFEDFYFSKNRKIEFNAAMKIVERRVQYCLILNTIKLMKKPEKSCRR